MLNIEDRRRYFSVKTDQLPRYSIKRVHGWKTYRVWDRTVNDWAGEPFETYQEARDLLSVLEGGR